MAGVHLIYDPRDEARAREVRAALEGAGVALAGSAQEAGAAVLLWSRRARRGLPLGPARGLASAGRLFLAPLDETPAPALRGLKRLDPRGAPEALAGRWGWSALASKPGPAKAPAHAPVEIPAPAAREISLSAEPKRENSQGPFWAILATGIIVLSVLAGVALLG